MLELDGREFTRDVLEFGLDLGALGRLEVVVARVALGSVDQRQKARVALEQVQVARGAFRAEPRGLMVVGVIGHGGGWVGRLASVDVEAEGGGADVLDDADGGDDELVALGAHGAAGGGALDALEPFEHLVVGGFLRGLVGGVEGIRLLFGQRLEVRALGLVVGTELRGLVGGDARERLDLDVGGQDELAVLVVGPRLNEDISVGVELAAFVGGAVEVNLVDVLGAVEVTSRGIVVGRVDFGVGDGVRDVGHGGGWVGGEQWNRSSSGCQAQGPAPLSGGREVERGHGLEDGEGLGVAEVGERDLGVGRVPAGLGLDRRQDLLQVVDGLGHLGLSRAVGDGLAGGLLEADEVGRGALEALEEGEARLSRGLADGRDLDDLVLEAARGGADAGVVAVVFADVQGGDGDAEVMALAKGTAARGLNQNLSDGDQIAVAADDLALDAVGDVLVETSADVVERFVALDERGDDLGDVGLDGPAAGPASAALDLDDFERHALRGVVEELADDGVADDLEDEVLGFGRLDVRRGDGGVDVRHGGYVGLVFMRRGWIAPTHVTLPLMPHHATRICYL